MANILIIESSAKVKPFLEDFSDTSIVHVRNSIILKNELGATLLNGEYQLEEVLSRKYDIIICCYASPYMPHIPYRKVIDENPQAELYWGINDHDVEDNQLLRYALSKGRTYKMICNNPREGYRGWILRKNILGRKLNDFITDWLTVNLNSLIMRDIPTRDVNKDGFIYYGTYRKWRSDDFKKHLAEGVTCSSSKKNWKKYEAINCNCNFIDKLEWGIGKETLRNYAFSLYIEDIHTHENYAFMANRFYECLMCDTVMLFDENTKNTREKSPYNIDSKFVIPEGDTFYNYGKKLNYPELIKEQRKHIPIALKEREETVSSIKSFLGVK